MTKKSLRWWTALIMSLGLTVGAIPAAAHAESDAGSVHTYRPTPGDVASERFTLRANDADVFVTKYSNRSNNRMHVARFASTDATPTLTVTANAAITSWKIYPERYYPDAAVSVSGNTLTFDLGDQLPYAIVRINGSDPGLAIINDPVENPDDVPRATDANVVNVGDFVTDLTGQTDQTAGITAAIDALYTTSGKDTLYFPDGFYTYAGLELRDRVKPVTIYVDEGALLKNRIQPTMTAMEPAIGIWDSANITISGRGVFDGNGFANYDTANGGWRHDAVSSHHQGGVMVVRSENIVFNDTLSRDAKQWNWETHTAKNVTFNNIKGLTPYAQPWIDGLDLASGQNVTVNGALTLGNDDTFASGHYNPSDLFLNEELNADRLEWDTEDSFNISVNDHLGWSAGAGNGIRLGYSAYGHALKSYRFDNVNYVGFSTGGYGITVHNQPDSGVRTYPRYEDISITNSSFDTAKATNNFGILGKSSADPGDRIASVALDDVWFSHSKPATAENITALTISNLTVAGQRIERLTQTPLSFTNVIERHLDFVEDVAPVIESIPDQETKIREHLAFTVVTSDGDGDAVTISAEDLPAGATLDAGTGQFSWTPSAAQAGTHTVTFRAEDARGATATPRAVKITVTDPSLVQVPLVAAADTNIQTWNAEEALNYGDNEHLRMLNFNDAALGPFGLGYPGGQSNKDAKVSYLAFDLEGAAEQLDGTEIVKAELSLTYFGPTKGALSGTNSLKVANAAAGWIEGDGKTTPTTRSNTVAGAVTWRNRAAVEGTAVVQSALFNVAAPAKVGSDSTYVQNQTPIGRVVTIDVTPLIAAGSTDVSFVLNETKKQDIIFVSREGAARNPKAAGMEPTLLLTVRKPVDRSALQSAIDGAATLESSQYSADTWPAFVQARSDAEAVLGDEEALQSEVDDAATALSAAQSALASAVTAITVVPAQTTFAVGGTLDPAILTVTATRANGVTEQLSTADFAVTGFDSATPGDRTVTVSIRSGLLATDGAAVSTTFTARVLPVWTASVTFLKGDQVLHNGSTWLAAWRSLGQEPGDPYGPWQEMKTTANGTALWTASRIFLARERAEFDGALYTAKWWTRNQAPGDPNGPWQPVG